VLTTDLLQSLINDAKNQGTLNLPIPLGAGSDFPVVQYADDTLLFLEAPTQLLVLKDLLSSFASATGLRVNYNKTVMLPINISQEKLKSLANTFQCQIGRMPFTYLGLPLGSTKPKIHDFLPLVKKVERRLLSTACFLSRLGSLKW
jgi:hypothetical protein